MAVTDFWGYVEEERREGRVKDFKGGGGAGEDLEEDVEEDEDIESSLSEGGEAYIDKIGVEGNRDDAVEYEGTG